MLNFKTYGSTLIHSLLRGGLFNELPFLLFITAVLAKAINLIPQTRTKA